MASRNFRQPAKTNVNGLVTVHCEITGDADIGTNGYVVTQGTGYVSSMTRTGEGTADLVLADKFHKLMGCSITSSDDATHAHYVSEDVDGASPKVSWKFSDRADVVSTFDAKDPDGATLWITLHLRNGAIS